MCHNDGCNRHVSSVPAAMLARQAVLLTLPRSSHPRPLLSRQHYAPVSPLAATLTNLPASIANKRLTQSLNPFDSTLTKNTGAGSALQLSAFLRSNVQRRNSFPVTSLAAPHLATSIESHPYKNHGGGGRLPPNNSHSGTRPSPPHPIPHLSTFKRSNVQTFHSPLPYLIPSSHRFDTPTSRRSVLSTFGPFSAGADGGPADQLSVLEQTAALVWRIICPTASVELRNSKPDRWIWQESWGNSHEYNGNNHYL